MSEMSASPEGVDHPGADGWASATLADFSELDQQWLRSALGRELADPRLTLMRNVGDFRDIRFDVSGEHGITSICWSDNHPGGHWVITAGPDELVGTAFQSEGVAVRAAMRGWAWPADWGPETADLEQMLTRQCPRPESAAHIPLRDRVSEDARVEPGLVDDSAGTGRVFMWPTTRVVPDHPSGVGGAAYLITRHIARRVPDWNFRVEYLLWIAEDPNLDEERQVVVATGQILAPLPADGPPMGPMVLGVKKGVELRIVFPRLIDNSEIGDALSALTAMGMLPPEPAK